MLDRGGAPKAFDVPLDELVKHRVDSVPSGLLRLKGLLSLGQLGGARILAASDLALENLAWARAVSAVVPLWP
ncbi:hypothetical protein ACQ5SK_42970 [Bradyrhizobium japonicum]